MEQAQGPGPEDSLDIGSPKWGQGYKDGWDKKQCASPDDATYLDGYQVGDAERDGGIDREGRYPIGTWLNNDLAPPAETYPEYYELPSDWNGS